MPYVVLMIITAVIGIISTLAINAKFSKWNKVESRVTLGGADIAREMLSKHGIQDPMINVFDGDELNNFYDPKSNSLNLSRRVAEGTSVSAHAVACHEAGHYLQNVDGYLPMRIRAFLVPVAKIGNYFSWIVLMIGLLFSSLGMMKIGALLYLGVIAFSIITLPVEFNASKRAIRFLDEIQSSTANTSMQGDYKREQSGVRSVLRAAAFTYIASTAVAILDLVWWLLNVLANFEN